MPARSIALGRREEASEPDTLRAALSELLATALFVFAAEGSIFSLAKIYKEFASTGGLAAVAVANGLALATSVAVSSNISGGHINPAVTFGVLLGGRISVIRAVFYWVAQLVGAIIASLLLKLTTGGMRPAGFSLATGVAVWQALILEIVLTFGLMYAIYATAVDPKRGQLGTIAPIIIGFILSANIIAGGPFDGASMNPARTFGPALVGWRWNHHWVYWVGPFVGAGLAGIIYEYLLIPGDGEGARTHQPLASED